MNGAGGAGLTVRSVETRGVKVPLNFPLGTSAAVVPAAPLLLVDLLTEEGVTGRAYGFGYTAAGTRAIAGLVAEAVEAVRGEPAAPAVLSPKLARRYALLGVTGPVRMALSALDMALWDAVALAAGLPLATLLGAAPRPVPAYDSRGLGLKPPGELAAEAERLALRDMQAIKLRLGHATLAEDLAALHAVRGAVPEGLPILTDYNQALDRTEALRRGRALESEGVGWLEEPIRHDDYAGSAALTAALDLPVQIGENFNGPEAMEAALDAGACDLVMPDVSRIGGVTGWMQAAGIAAARGVPMSSHLMPEVSAHLLAATPTAQWLEYVDWADRILAEPLEIEGGRPLVPDRPGTGMVWDEAAVARLETL
jgi:mandelate racemase